MCNVHKGVWKENQSNSYDVAIKVLKKENEDTKTKVYSVGVKIKYTHMEINL